MLSCKWLNQKFIASFKKVKAYAVQILFATLMLLLFFIVYWRDLEVLANEALNAEALSHVFLMPFFIGYLFYQRKESAKASIAIEVFQKKSRTRYLDALVGFSLCLMAFLLYWYGSYTFYPLEYHMLSLPIFAAGVVLVLFNFNMLRALLLPILFLFFLVPLPSESMYTLGGALANFNTQASYALLKALGFPVTLSYSYGAPTINLATSAESTSFSIDLPCSGIYTLIAFAMFATFLALIVSGPFWKKMAIFLLGFPVFEVLNILRITAIISVAAFFGEEIAMTIFHSVAGLILVFVGMMLTLFMSEKFLKIKFTTKRHDAPSCPKCTTSRKALEGFCLNCGKFLNSLRWKPPQIFWMKLIILLSIFSTISLSVNAPVFAITRETIQVTSGWEDAANILPQLPQYHLECLGRDTRYEQLAKQDAAITYVYIPTNISIPVVYALISVASSISNLHSWEVCLITWRTAQGQYPLANVLDSRDVALLGETLIARYLVFQDLEQNYTQVTLYWYERATFRIGGTIQQKYVRISLLILTDEPANYPQHEDYLLDFGLKIAHHWEPIKSQSLVSLGVPAQQTLLVALTAFIAATKITQYTSELRKRSNNLKIFNHFATPEDKLVLQAITELSKEKKTTTTKNINLAIKNKIGRFMKFERLMERLNHLQDYGFIKRGMVFINNKPFLIWRSLVNL
ncbi:MAG: exosortase/archaeosortase family protein [Candidatus Bathyarchaeia archaeon]